MLKDTLVAYFHTRTPSTLHVLITQDIKMTYRISPVSYTHLNPTCGRNPPCYAQGEGESAEEATSAD